MRPMCWQLDYISQPDGSRPPVGQPRVLHCTTRGIRPSGRHLQLLFAGVMTVLHPGFWSSNRFPVFEKTGEIGRGRTTGWDGAGRNGAQMWPFEWSVVHCRTLLTYPFLRSLGVR